MAIPFYYGQDPATGQPIYVDPATGQPVPPPAPPPVSAAPRITNESDPRRAAMQDRQWAYGQGEDLDRYFRENLQNNANDVRSANEYAQGLFDPLAQGRGGINPTELERILQAQQMGELQMSPEEIASAGLSDEERSQIQGNPWDRMKYFNPNAENQIMDETQGFRRGAVDAYGRDLSGSFDPNVLRSSPKFYDALAQGRDQFAGNARGVLDSSQLTVSPEFLQEHRMSPEEQQRIVTGAGITAGMGYKAAIAEAERRARAAGVNPLGVAAMRARGERAMAADSADAITQAKIGASDAAANRLRAGEGMRLQYGQNLAGMKVGAERDIADSAYRTAMGAEDVRGAQERDVANRRFQAADAAGQQRIGNETALARERLALQQGIGDRGNAYQRDVEGTMAERNRDLALNRQGTAQYLQAQRYGRGLSTADRLSDRYRYGADTRRQDAQEGRGYAATAANRANDNWNRTQDRRLGLYGAMAGAGQGATRTQGQLYEAEQNRPKWWEKLLGGGLGAAGAIFGGGFEKGGIVTKPTYALIGEAGPEAVVPLNQGTRRIHPAYSQQYRYGS